MKKLLTLLIRKVDHEWWEVRSSEGTPPEERVRMYVFGTLLDIIKRTLERIVNKEKQ
jgi:hypothetical protein